MMTNHLYVHIPFCNSICAYCDFSRCGYNENLADRYLDILNKELSERVLNNDLKTIYIGGGTPSSLSYSQLKRLLEMLNPYSGSVIEYTFEANPESLSTDKIELLAEYNINRISLGLQAVQKNLLSLMNRKHSFEDVENLINNLKDNGIDNISVDLIYSLPTQTMADWEQSLNKVIELEISHVSVYSLTIEEHSEFGRKGYMHLSEDTESEMYFLAIEKFNEAGLLQYEIANFASKGFESRHNSAYWKYNDFYGIGLGASSKVNDIRYDNTRNFSKYLNGEYIEERYDLSKEDNMFEMIMMSLRTKKGLDKQLFRERYAVDVEEHYSEAVIKNLKLNNLISDDKYLRCSDSALAILNTILQDFI